jgi:misacylated tRNA(Ala) deacylase
MTRLLFREDAYLTEAPARVAGHTAEGALILDASLFYPAGGGQPGDSGLVTWDGGRLRIATALKSGGGGVALVPAEAVALPPVGAAVRQVLDWDRRYRHMRVHTALHLLSVVLPVPVTGGAIGEARGRLDFDLPDPPHAPDIERALAALIDRDLPVSEDWITDQELAATPGLVKTLSVAPPTGQGRVRLVRIGLGSEQIDLQPCGGTHVARTAEIGHVAVEKIEKKGRQNRRVVIVLA